MFRRQRHIQPGNLDTGLDSRPPLSNLRTLNSQLTPLAALRRIFILLLLRALRACFSPTSCVFVERVRGGKRPTLGR